MDQYAKYGTILPKVCHFTNHEKTRKISAPVQCQARFNPAQVYLNNPRRYNLPHSGKFVSILTKAYGSVLGSHARV